VSNIVTPYLTRASFTRGYRVKKEYRLFNGRQIEAHEISRVFFK